MLILKAGTKSTQRTDGGAAGYGGEFSYRALDAKLMKVESEAMNGHANPSDSIAPNMGAALNPPALPTKAPNGMEDDYRLMVELHCIQGMLGMLKKKKKRHGGSNVVGSMTGGTPERYVKVERLRLQLQEQEVLEQRQIELKSKNKQL